MFNVWIATIKHERYLFKFEDVVDTHIKHGNAHFDKRIVRSDWDYFKLMKFSNGLNCLIVPVIVSIIIIKIIIVVML